ncbi:hypothetical protein E2C01_088090 [Portunus trituberculatus]|uniref:Uncharacterized protein n=1 Tax=Portunus trituberculatus TaxID=210409 RepID=A0A5B7JEG2_PORTR|nr:hypothetical protein [Portunus trituberculatus]
MKAKRRARIVLECVGEGSGMVLEMEFSFKRNLEEHTLTSGRAVTPPADFQHPPPPLSVSRGSDAIKGKGSRVVVSCLKV